MKKKTKKQIIIDSLLTHIHYLEKRIENMKKNEPRLYKCIGENYEDELQMTISLYNEKSGNQFKYGEQLDI